MTDADRVARAAAELRKKIPYLAAPSHEFVARIALEAADGEPAKWPTDECVSAAYGERADLATEAFREKLRYAMLADPVVKAAIDLVQYWAAANIVSQGSVGVVHELDLAVKEAGLLDG